jgi:hypothetical protein
LEPATVYSFPRAAVPRFGDAAADDTPGPGAYNLTGEPPRYTRWAERLIRPSKRWHPPEDPTARPWKAMNRAAGS